MDKLQWCEGCLRQSNGKCEAFTEAYEGCFAKETDFNKYIKGLEETRDYNRKKNSSQIAMQVTRRINKVMKDNLKVSHDNTKL